jgi:hypothetical protein
MTPNEKAKELVDKMLNADVAWEFTYNCAKQCALIAVDEILKSPTPKQKKYWELVKQEIKKL